MMGQVDIVASMTSDYDEVTITVEYNEDDKDIVDLAVGSYTTGLSREDALALANVLIAYSKGFVFPPESGLKVPDDQHVSFPS